MKLFKTTLSFITLLTSAITNAMAAPFVVDPGTGQGIGGIHVAGQPRDKFLGIPIRDLGELLSILVQSAIILAGVAFFVYLLFGGIRWLTSGGDAKATQSARDSIATALVGLIIVVSTYGIIRIVEGAFGITILSGNIVFPSP